MATKDLFWTNITQRAGGRVYSTKNNTTYINLNTLGLGSCYIAMSLYSSSPSRQEFATGNSFAISQSFSQPYKITRKNNASVTDCISHIKSFFSSITKISDVNTCIQNGIFVVCRGTDSTKLSISKNFARGDNLLQVIDINNIQLNTSGLVKNYAVYNKNSKMTNGYALVDSNNNLIKTGKDNIYNFCTTLTNTDNARQFTLLKTHKKENGKYYTVEISGAVGSKIASYMVEKGLATSLSDTPNDDYDYDGGGGGGGGGGSAIDTNYQTTPYKPGANGINLADHSIGAIAYISDFTKFNLVFKKGLDSRTNSIDNSANLDVKVLADEDDLIIRTNISKQAFDIVDSNISLSDKYFSFSKVADFEIEAKEFFTRLDEVLDLDFNYQNQNIWKSILPPILDLSTLQKNSIYNNIEKNEDYTGINESSYYESQWEELPLNWKLIPMSAFAVKRDWYNSYTKKDLTIEETQNELTIYDCFSNISNSKPIGLNEFYNNFTLEERKQYKLLFFDIYFNSNKITETKISKIKDFNEFLSKINQYIIFGKKIAFNSTFIFEQKQKTLNLYELKMFEAYTRGHDFIQEDYTTVRPTEQDKNGNKYMNFDDNYFSYKYTGRKFDLMNLKNDKDKEKLFELPQSKGVYCALVHEKDLLTESDVTLGETYGEKKYFTEVIKYYNPDTKKYEYKDTFKVKNYLDIVDSTKYTEDDIECITAKIDLTQCKYYDATKATYENKWCDCSYSGSFNKECIYQKLGYCPYRFDTEKHPRRIRTLSGEKSNRFNLIQELSSVFKIYPQFYIEFDKNGRVILDENGYMKKHIFFITEKGNLKNLGFRYEKNLNSITRSIDSTAITTKMFVEDIDSEYSDTGLCSIQTAEDNVGKTNYLLDFSYYTKKGIIDPLQITRDIYGINKGDMAFLPTIGYYNTKYDGYTNLIINMTGETMTEMKAKNDVSIESISTCLVERQKLAQKMYQFKVKKITEGKNIDYTTSDTYKSYLEKYKEQSAIMWGNVEDLFFSNNYFNLIKIENEQDKETYTFTSTIFNLKNEEVENEETKNISEEECIIKTYNSKYCKGEFFWRLMIEGFEEEPDYVPPFDNWEVFKEKIVEHLLYPINGNLGQYKSLNDQVKHWKLERSKWLNKINDIADKFYKKYEPYIKEGTWTDDNYLTDNEYFWAANNVLSDSCKPKVSYTVNVSDISTLDNDYLFDLSDTSFVEDIDIFGINQRTGLPNQQKVIISGITEDLDNPTNNSLEIQNFTTSFDELFESISASVQSLTFNENTYKRAANFTATKYISKDSLQGTLFDGDLTLMDTNNGNIVIEDDGISGKEIVNTSNQYKLTGEGLFFSKDGGQTWDIGVGPSGINADYIKFGQLDASKIQIVDGNYIYFLWDKSGITAYRNPATSTNGLVDFTRFNKYGLSLIENNKIRLRAGYEFKNGEVYNNSGDYKTEYELTNQNVGFYLYNDNGQSIFRTETASLYGDNKNYSARMSLNGEMFITNKVLDGDPTGGVISKEYEYAYSGGKKVNEVVVATLYKNDEMKKIYENEDKYFLLDMRNNAEDNISPQNEENSSIITENNIAIQDGKKYVLLRKRSSVSSGQNIMYYQNSTNTRLYKAVHEQITQIDLIYETLSLSISDNDNTAWEQLEHYVDCLINKKELQKDVSLVTTSLYRQSATIFERVPEINYELRDINKEILSDMSISQIDNNIPTNPEDGPNEEQPGEEASVLSEDNSSENTNTGDNTSNNNTDNTTDNTEDDADKDSPDIKVEYDNSKKEIYTGTTRVIVSIVGDNPADVVKTYDNIELQPYEFWDITLLDNAENVYLDSSEMYSLYKTFESGVEGSTYWTDKELSGESRNANSTDILTDEVGVFINNKTSIDGGSEIVKQYGTTLLGKAGTATNTSETEDSNTSETEDSTNKNENEDNTNNQEDTNTQTLSRESKETTVQTSVNVDDEGFFIIGDSLTVGLHNSSDFKDRAVGVGSAITNIFDQDLSGKEKLTKKNSIFYDNSGNSKVKVLTLFFGANEINRNKSQSDYENDIRKLLSNYSKDPFNYITDNTHIYFVSPIHGSHYTQESYDKYTKNYLAALQQIASNPQDIKGTIHPSYIDIHSKSKELSFGSDGIHLTASGYQMLYNLIKDAFANNTDYKNTEAFKAERTNIEGLDEARDTVLAGAERVYMIALAGRDSDNNVVYNNVLTVLKNGCLYIGGTVNDFYGRKLNLNHLGQMPDEVRINDAEIIMANNGMVWMNFKKVFMIDDTTKKLSDVSLWQAIGSGVKSSGTDKEEGDSTNDLGIPSGYYLIDPIKD